DGAAREDVDPRGPLDTARLPGVGIDLAEIVAGAIDRERVTRPDLDARPRVGRLVGAEGRHALGRGRGGRVARASRLQEAEDLDVASALGVDQVGARIAALADQRAGHGEAAARDRADRAAAALRRLALRERDATQVEDDALDDDLAAAARGDCVDLGAALGRDVVLGDEGDVAAAAARGAAAAWLLVRDDLGAVGAAQHLDVAGGVHGDVGAVSAGEEGAVDEA